MLHNIFNKNTVKISDSYVNMEKLIKEHSSRILNKKEKTKINVVAEMSNIAPLTVATWWIMLCIGPQ